MAIHKVAYNVQKNRMLAEDEIEPVVFSSVSGEMFA